MPLPICWMSHLWDCCFFFLRKTSWITFILQLVGPSWFPWAADWRALPYTALPVGWSAVTDSQDSGGRKVETAESSKKISKISKITSQSLETLYCLPFLSHCSSLEPCAPSCEWWALIIDTARGGWFLWARDQVGRILQVPFGPQWKDRTWRQNLSQTVS